MKATQVTYNDNNRDNCFPSSVSLCFNQHHYNATKTIDKVIPFDSKSHSNAKVIVGKKTSPTSVIETSTSFTVLKQRGHLESLTRTNPSKRCLKYSLP